MASRQRPCIAVVDDAPEFLDLLHDVLDDRADVHAYASPELSTDDLAAIHPELLIIDLRFGSDTSAGWHLLMEAHHDPRLKEVPIIVCTADAPTLRAHEADVAAMDAVQVLPKPFGLEDLERLVTLSLSGPDACLGVGAGDPGPGRLAI